jgi:aromatic ring-opening dioxygenase catalytic subunit (LigB family)
VKAISALSMRQTCLFVVLQVSLKKNLNILDHLKLGEALEPLRREDVLIIGSGQTTHNQSPIPGWCEEFTTWFHDVMTNPSYSPDERKRRLLDCTKQPTLAIAHPRIEHFLPALVAAAAAGYQPGNVIFNQTTMGSMVISHVKF